MNISAIHFESPFWFFGLLALLPLLIRLFRRRRESAVVFSSLELLSDVKPSIRERFRPLVPWFRVIGLACIVIALARPQEGLSGFRVRTEGIAIQICLDRSTSMSAEDFTLDGKQVSRLRAVKEVIRKFVVGDEDAGLAGRPDDQLGLIAFGGYAEVRCPATLDHEVFEDILGRVNLPDPARHADGSVIQAAYQIYIEEGATAIGDALATAVDQLKQSEAKSKVIILLSDGEHNRGVLSPEQATQIAQEFGVRVYSIGVGSTGQHFVRLVDRFGTMQYQPMPLKLDEKMLTRIADETGGRYFHAEDTAGLLDVYREINELEKTSTEGTKYREYRELCQPWLLAGLLLIGLEVLLNATLFRGVP